MENKSHALAAGLFVLVVSGLLLGMTSWLTRDKRTGEIYEMSTSEAVTGLSVQAAVRFRGITVGKVEHIGFDPENRENVLVRININSDLPLTTGTYATLGYQGVTGLAFVQLDNEGNATQALTTDDSKPTRIPLRPGMLSQFADQGTFLLQQAQSISERVSALFSPENQETIIGTVKSIGDSAEKLGAASESMQAILNAQFGPERTDIPALVADTRATMSTLQATATELSATARAATQTAESLSEVAKGVTAPNGMLDQLSTTASALAKSAEALNAHVLPSVARAADSAARTADSTTRAAEGADRAIDALLDNPQSFIYGNGRVLPGPGEPGFSAPANANANVK